MKPLLMYRVEQWAPRGADYADCFFEVYAFSEKEAWKKAKERAQQKILNFYLVKCGYV